MSFIIDKIENPEFFCWPGAWMAGPNSSLRIKDIFLRHVSLYSDRPDKMGVYARQLPGKSETDILNTMNIFYGNNIAYDLTRQWILSGGEFQNRFDWLSDRHSFDEIFSYAQSIFGKIFNVTLDAFEVIT